MRSPLQRFRKGDTIRASARLALLREADRKLVTPPELLPSWKWFDPKRGTKCGVAYVGDPPAGRSALEGYSPPWCPKHDRETCARHVERERKRIEPSAPKALFYRLSSWCTDSSFGATAIAVSKVRGCRYPLGEPRSPDFHFCNKKRTPGSAYCSEHAELCERRVR